jgi:hypothetical protein
MSILLFLAVAPVSIVEQPGCDNSACASSNDDCQPGWRYSSAEGGNCQQNCDASVPECFEKINRVVDEASRQGKSLFGWVAIERNTQTSTPRIVGFQNCSADCALKTYTVAELEQYRNSGLETFSSAYPTRSRRRQASHSTFKQYLVDVEDDDDDTDYVPIIVGVSIGSVALIGLVATVWYIYRPKKRGGITDSLM